MKPTIHHDNRVASGLYCGRLDTLEPIREGIVEINGHRTTIPAEIPDEAAHLLQSLKTLH